MALASTKLMEVKKHLKVYWQYIKFSLMSVMVYRVSFFIELFVELGYVIWTLFFFQVVYGNVTQVAGWSYHEVLFLIGVNTVVVEFLVGLVFVWGTRVLPEKIKDGTIDFLLLKPVDSMFHLTLARPYLSSFVSTIPGFFLIGYALSNLQMEMNLINLFAGIFILLMGLIIAYCILVIPATLAFKFINASFLPRWGLLLVDYSRNPHPVYTTSLILKVLFFLVIPVVFAASIPARAWLGDLQLSYLPLSAGLAVIFLIITRKFWGAMIKNYASASS